MPALFAGWSEKGIFGYAGNEVFEKEIEHITKRLETLEHTVYGNGHKGLKAELIELKTEIETFKKIAVWQVGILLAILCAVLKILI